MLLRRNSRIASVGDHFHHISGSILSVTTMSILLIILKKLIILGSSTLQFKKMLMNSSITGVHIGMLSFFSFFLFDPVSFSPLTFPTQVAGRGLAN